jgi:hypothetical protein
MKFIARDYSFTEHDQLVRFVYPYLGKHEAAFPVTNGQIVIGWQIKPLRD